MIASMLKMQWISTRDMNLMARSSVWTGKDKREEGEVIWGIAQMVLAMYTADIILFRSPVILELLDIRNIRKILAKHHLRTQKESNPANPPDIGGTGWG
jgi:hypothetical protein